MNGYYQDEDDHVGLILLLALVAWAGWNLYTHLWG